MGRIIVEQIISADGFVAAPDGSLDFFQLSHSFDATDPGQMTMLKRVGAILLGANTYRMFSSYWPTADDRVEVVAGPINALPKHVVSSTLESAPWGDRSPAFVEHGDGVDVARRLARQYDGDIIVWGSLQLASALLAAGAVDHLRLRVVPVLIGAGLAVAPSLRTPIPLVLDSVDRAPGSHVTLAYDLPK